MDPRENDIQQLQRADIERRNWDRMHIQAERRQPLMLGDARRRWCSGRGAWISVRSQVA